MAPNPSNGAEFLPQMFRWPRTESVHRTGFGRGGPAPALVPHRRL